MYKSYTKISKVYKTSGFGVSEKTTDRRNVLALAGTKNNLANSTNEDGQPDTYFEVNGDSLLEREMLLQKLLKWLLLLSSIICNHIRIHRNRGEEYNFRHN